jgi:hypothetical protein
MIANLAEEIYANSIQLKKYDSRKLLFNKNRLALEKELYQIQSQVNEIIILLKDNPNYSVEYIKLAMFMSNQITECILFLTTKGRAYRETVSRYIWGFHNLPRAFLASSNSMCISPDDALEYYKPYVKMD